MPFQPLHGFEDRDDREGLPDDLLEEGELELDRVFVPVPDILGRLKGDINYGHGRVTAGTKQYMKFWSEHASYPFKSHDLWFVTEDIRWGKFEATTDAKALVNKVNREDLWRAAAKTLGVAAADIPATPSRGCAGTAGSR